MALKVAEVSYSDGNIFKIKRGSDMFQTYLDI